MKKLEAVKASDSLTPSGKKNRNYTFSFGRLLSGLALLAATLIPSVQAATFYLKTGGDSANMSSFNMSGSTPAGWTNAANPTASAPAAGNDYHVNVQNLRSPIVAGTYTFQGDHLYIDTGGRFLGKPPSGGATCSANYVLNGGNCDPATATSDNNILTLAGTVTANAASALGAYGATSSGSTFETLDLTAPISGSAALQISGSKVNGGAATGVVRLSAANSYSGTITVTNANGGIVASTVNRILQLNNLNALSNATLNLTATVNNPLSFSNVVNTGAFNIGALSGVSSQTLTDTAGSPVTLSVGGNNASTTYSGVLSGSGSLVKTGSGTLVLTNANTFSGGTMVNGGTMALDFNVGDNPTGTLAGGQPVTLNANGTLRLDVEDVLGYNGGIPSALNINDGLVTSADVANTTPVQTTGGTSFRVTLPTVNFRGGTLSSGANNQGDQYGGSYLMNGVNTYSNSATAVINAYSLSFNNGNGTFTVAAGNTPSGVDLEVSSLLGGWFGGFSLTKAGAGVMELDQNSTPSAVNVNAGTLILNGTFGTGPIAVAANAKFLASGSLNGAITVATGGTLGVGTTNINSLISYSTVTFNSGSTNYMKISKNGNSAQSDQVQYLTSVAFAGTLVVSNITSDASPIVSGDTFSFFPSSLAYSGNFSSVVLPALPVGLGWDISQLNNGIIMVSSSAAPPTFSPVPGGYPGALTVTISSLTPGATIYYTTDGSTPTTSSPSGTTPVSVMLPANTNITIQAFAFKSGYSASSVQSAAYSTYTTYTWANPSGGNWSTTANWSNNAVANGVGTPADFSELTLSGSPTVSLDIPATVGSLIFGDQANANSWTLADSGAGPLTLNNGTNAPMIVVSNQTTTISAALAGSTGFVKTGSGTLVLNNHSANSGSLVVSNGTVALGYNPGDGPTGTLAAGTTNTVNGGGTLLMNIEDAMGWGSGSTALLNINGGLVTSADVANSTPVQWGGTSFRVTLPTVNFTGGMLSSGTNNQGDQYGAGYMVNNVNTLASSTTATINAYNVSLNNGTFTVASGTTPSGVDLNVVSIMQDIFGSKGFTKAGPGVMKLSGANTYSGGVQLNGGILNLANVNALGANGNTLFINATASAAELSTDVGFGGANLYNVTLNQIGPYVGTMILNRATPGASTPITHNFGALVLSLNYGAPTALNVLAGPNAPTGGTVDTLAFSGLTFGNWYSVTETLAPTNANLIINGTAAAAQSQGNASTQFATLDLDGTSTGNQITGAIVDNSSGNTYNAAAILKSNRSTWTLTGANTYTGNTTISGGTLALAGSGSIANTPNITIAGGATFDVSGLSSPFVLGSSQTLGNSSSTAVFAGSGSTGTGKLSLNYTNGLPALTVSNGTLTLSSSTVFQVNNTGSQLPGGTYTLISTVAGGAVTGTVPANTVTVAGGGAASTATLAITNGQLNLVVASSVNTNPTNITATVSGNTLSLSWPADHLGWTLQTNSVGLTATNQWFPYPGSASVTNVSIPMDNTKTNVFFRMVYP